MIGQITKDILYRCLDGRQLDIIRHTWADKHIDTEIMDITVNRQAGG